MNCQLRIMKKERGFAKGSKANTSTYCGSETNEQHTDRLPGKKVKNECTWFKIKLTSLCRQWVWGELYQRQTWFEPRWQKSRPAHRRTLQGYQRGKEAWQRGQHLGNNEIVLHKTFTIFCSVNLIDMIPDINVAAANTLKIPQRSCHQMFQLLG